MTISELKMLFIFMALEAYTAVASWIFIVAALIITAIDSKIERLNKWTKTFPGMIALTTFGCAIAATMAIVMVLVLAEVACQQPLHPSPLYQEPPNIASQ